MRTIDREKTLLDALARAPQQWSGLRALASEVGLPPSSAHRLLHSLASVGFVTQDPRNQGYRLGSTMLRLAGAYLSKVGFSDVVLPYLEHLTSDTSALSFASVRDGNVVICTSVRVPQEATNFYVRIGKTLPWHVSAAAKALVAGIGEEALRRHLRLDVQHAYTSHTLTSVEEVLADLEKGRIRGYWECVEELEPGIYAVAAPIVATGDRPIASLTVVCRMSQDHEKLLQLATQVVHVARSASAEFGDLLHAGQFMEAAQ